MENTKAPDLTPGYPSHGAKLGPAWQAVWNELSKATSPMDAVDGRSLASRIAPDYGLAPATLVALMSRAAKAGLLEREGFLVETAAGLRNRTHYFIPLKELEARTNVA